MYVFIYRLDAGTFGTMGVGLGFAIAASVLVKYKDKNLDPPASRVVCIQGDSAFGFSGMEMETVFRLVSVNSGPWLQWSQQPRTQGLDSLSAEANWSITDNQNNKYWCIPI